jgi:endonuclease III
MVNNTVDLHAYAIPLLHAAKYPSSAVCGVLLGKNTTDGSVIKSAVPFFHHWTTLTPMLEVALKQVSEVLGRYLGNVKAKLFFIWI